MQEVQRKEADEQKDQEAAGAWTEQAIVKADRTADQHRQALLLAADLRGLCRVPKSVLQKV